MNYDLFIPSPVVEQDSAAALPSDTRRAAPRGLGRSADSGPEGFVPIGTGSGGSSDRPPAGEVAGTVAALNDIFEHNDVALQYRIDESTKDLVVSVVDRKTGRVLRQVPPDEILRMRQRLQELMGVFFDATA